MSSTPKPLKKGFKFRIYPTAEQKSLIERTFGCCRYVFNRALAESKAEYEQYTHLLDKGVVNKKARPDVSGYAFVNKLPSYRLDPETPWLAEVSNVALQQAMLHLGGAYTRFFRTKKGYPRFKRKHDRQSFNLMKNGFTLRDDILRIAKCKDPIKVVYSRPLPSEPSSLTISRTPAGDYYVSFICEYTPTPTSGTGCVGIDLGLTQIATFSDGTKLENPRHYVKAQKQLRRAQQALSRKQKGSRNRDKARLKVAKQHEHVANCRRDHLHKLSRTLVNENQVFGIEGLNVSGMVRNRRLAKHVQDAGWGMLRRMIEYKVVESQHATLVVMDTFFPSSHICATTGKKLERKLKLSERTWDCPHCGQTHDRDVNAAQVIALEADYAATKHPSEDVRGKILLAASRTH